LLVCLALASGVVLARPPLAVGLTSFEAFPSDGVVRLAWHTETEVNTVAYLLRRSEDGSTPIWLEHLGAGGYILADGGPAVAADYEEADDTVSNGTRYTYYLYEVESNSSETEIASLTVTAGIPTATPTSTPSPTPSPIIISVSQVTDTATPISRGQGPLPTPTHTIAPTQLSTAPAVTTPTPEEQDDSTGTAGTPVGAMETTRRVSVPLLESTTPSPNIGPGESESAPISSLESENAGIDEARLNSAIAQVPPTETAAYPGPVPSPVASTRDNGYPPLEAATSVEDGPAAYPSAPGGETGSALPVVGAQSVETTGGLDATDKPGSAIRGRIVLWVGFILAFLIFVGAVVGSIILFTRKRE
jgi:hypothetical protein